MDSAARYRGQALLMQAHVQEGLVATRKAMVASRSGGYLCFVSGTYCTLAETYAKTRRPEEGMAVISEALCFVQESDERHFEAEIYRLRAELQLLQGDDAEAEASFLKAVEVARRQSARSWELRAATGLARLWQKQNRRDEALETLAGVFDWFSEGFETPDLQEARALLDELL